MLGHPRAIVSHLIQNYIRCLVKHINLTYAHNIVRRCRGSRQASRTYMNANIANVAEDTFHFRVVVNNPYDTFIGPSPMDCVDVPEDQRDW
jgi:hypothetical protein